MTASDKEAGTNEAGTNEAGTNEAGTNDAGREVVIHTDGACLGNPGPGGWAAVLQWGGHSRELFGAEPQTTNQRMELRAAVEALSALKRPCRVRLHSDSAYLINAFRNGWLDRWRANGWLTVRKHPVENQDLWRGLDELITRHEVTWVKVAGHAGNPLNERCDELAQKAARSLNAD